MQQKEKHLKGAFYLVDLYQPRPHPPSVKIYSIKIKHESDVLCTKKVHVSHTNKRHWWYEEGEVYLSATSTSTATCTLASTTFATIFLTTSNAFGRPTMHCHHPLYLFPFHGQHQAAFCLQRGHKIKLIQDGAKYVDSSSYSSSALLLGGRGGFLFAGWQGAIAG